MNANKQTVPSCLFSSRKTSQLVALLACTLSGNSDRVLSAEDYYQNVLTNPSEAVLRAEANGSVTIYDGLEHKVVDQALDTQFQRIDHMMFVRTRETMPDGSIDYYDDDDCD